MVYISLNTLHHKLSTKAIVNVELGTTKLLEDEMSLSIFSLLISIHYWFVLITLFKNE